MTTKVLIYEDNEDLRNSLCSLINFSEKLKLVAAFENCKDILNHLKFYSPDIVLMDIDMPVKNGIEGLKLLRAEDANLPVIMLTVFDDNHHILDAIKNGANGYILKQHLTTRLGTAIEEALEGGAPMSPMVASLILKQISQPPTYKKGYTLTLREKEILQALTDGNSFKMIAAQLFISPGTVSTHIKNIYEKLGVHSQAEAVSKTLKEGIL